MNLHLGTAARSEVNLSKWFKLAILVYEGMVSRRRAGCVVCFNSTYCNTHKPTLIPLLIQCKQGCGCTYKAAPLQGSLSSNGWRTSLRPLSHCHSQHCHLAVILREAWRGDMTYCAGICLLTFCRSEYSSDLWIIQALINVLYLLCRMSFLSNVTDLLRYHEAASLCIGVGLQ